MPTRVRTRWAHALNLRAEAWAARLQSGSSRHGTPAACVAGARRAEHNASLLLARQTAHLRKVLTAAATAAAYADVAGLLTQRGGDPQKSAADMLSGLPILTKEQVRHGLHDFLVPAPGPVDVRITSGTSGDVTQIVRPRSATIERAAIARRLFDSLALPTFFTLAVVVPWDQEPVDSWGLIDWRICLRQTGLTQLMKDFDSPEAPPAELIMTSPSMCTLITEHVAGELATVSAWEVPGPVRTLLGVAPPSPPESPAEMYVSAEMITPIAIRYPDCPALHVNSDAVYVETVNPHNGEKLGPGTPGLLVLTDLLNTSMPFVRYQIGDVGFIEEDRCCPCGRITPVMTLLGRAGARTAETKTVASRLTTKGRWILVEHDNGVPLLLTDVAGDMPTDGQPYSVRPLPDRLRTVPPGGLVISIRERYPVADWRNRSLSDLRIGARSPHAAFLDRRHATHHAPTERGR